MSNSLHWARAPTRTRRFLVLHGWRNRRPPRHWQFWLVERLRSKGEQVLYPQLPRPDEPRMEDWIELVEAELAQLGGGEKVVICHSLSCLLWAHASSRLGARMRVDRLLWVAPPGPSKLVPQLAPFAPDGVGAHAIRRSARLRHLVCGDDDPHCPERADRLYGPLGFKATLLRGAGHLDLEAGYGPWPAVERWARARSRASASGSTDRRPALGEYQMAMAPPMSPSTSSHDTRPSVSVRGVAITRTFPGAHSGPSYGTTGHSKPPTGLGRAVDEVPLLAERRRRDRLSPTLVRLSSVEDRGGRNMLMSARIESAPLEYPFSFVIAGDSGAWPDPTADAIFAQLLRQTAELDPAPAFFANLGDFAGPGTRDRHEHYLELVAPLRIPNVCLIGNHDLEDPAGAEAWDAIHGPRNFQFACAGTRFVAIDGASGQRGHLGDTRPPDTAGPGPEALRFLDEALAAAGEPHRVVLLHAPPHLEAHYSPQPECGFRQGEREFMEIIRRHGVRLVCCAHGLGYDHHVDDGVRFVMSGGGGAALYLSYKNAGRDRGAIFHAVQITLKEGGAASGRVLQAFAPPDADPPFTFSD